MSKFLYSLITSFNIWFELYFIPRIRSGRLACARQKERRLVFSTGSPYRDFLLDAPFLTWRTRLPPIRTASEVPVKIIIQPLQRTPLYQKLAKKVEELLLLGMSFRAIGRSLGVSKRTVIRTYKYINRPFKVK